MASLTDTKWSLRFTDVANQIASWSKDSTKVGCVIVDDRCDILATGYNGYPRGVDDTVEDRKQRPAKYFFTAHAEANACFSAARRGVKLEGSTLFLSNLYPHTTMPCAECAKAIIQSGIKRVVCEFPHVQTEQWEEHFQVTRALFQESGVEVAIRPTRDNLVFMLGYRRALEGHNRDMQVIQDTFSKVEIEDYDRGYAVGLDRRRLCAEETNG